MNTTTHPVTQPGSCRARRRGRCMHGLCMLLLAVACAPARAVPTCTVASAATLSFGAVVALASTGDVTTNSGTSFWVNCTSDVAAAPTLYSGSPRTLMSGGNSLPFTLSASAPGGAALPAVSPGASLGVLRNGTQQTVTLYGKIAASDFKALPSGFYSTSVTLMIEY